MKYLTWTLSGALAIGSGAQVALAQAPASTFPQPNAQTVSFPRRGNAVPQWSYPCPSPITPTMPSTLPRTLPGTTMPGTAPSTTTPGTTPSTTDPNAATRSPDSTSTQPQQRDSSQQNNDNLGAGESSKNLAGGGTLASAGTGLASTAAAATTAAGVTTITQTQVGTPLILPGLLTSAAGQSALPVDRISFDYGYFDAFRVSAPARIVNGAVVQDPGTVAGFNLNTYTVSLEKTFADGRGSIYVNVPFLDATQNISGQAIDGLGNINAGAKFVIFRDQIGNTFTAGFTASAPTARASSVTSISASTSASPLIGPQVLTATTTLDPTYLQPWFAGIWTRDRFFVHEYFGVIIPTDDRIPSFINNALTVGYTIYECPRGRISSVTPTVGAQVLVPLSNRGAQAGGVTTTTVTAAVPPPPPTTPSSFSFPDQVFLMGGAQIGLGQRAFFTGNVVTPVAGPRGYSVGAMVGLTFLY